MKLHTVFITHNRLELTKRAIESYRETVSVPHNYIVVDNGSMDGTDEWLKGEVANFLLLEENRYPGFATNTGWEYLSPNATHLHRADNDYGFLPGWCDEVARVFKNEKVGQVGLRTGEQESHSRGNVGGNCVIRRELWDAGLRYDERPWPEYPPGYSEDSYFSPAVREMGYTWKRVSKVCIHELEAVYESTNIDPYYELSWGRRHLYGRVPD